MKKSYKTRKRYFRMFSEWCNVFVLLVIVCACTSLGLFPTQFFFQVQARRSKVHMNMRQIDHGKSSVLNIKTAERTKITGTQIYSPWFRAEQRATTAARHGTRPAFSLAIILTDSVSLLQKVKSGMGSSDWHVSMFDIHLRKILWVICPGHAGVKRGNDRADRLAGKSNHYLRFGRSEVLRSLIHYLRAQSQGHHAIDRLEERGVERGNAQ